MGGTQGPVIHLMIPTVRVKMLFWGTLSNLAESVSF